MDQYKEPVSIGTMPHKDACDMIDDMIRFREDLLTTREREFLESVYENTKYPFLTVKQEKWLNTIFDRVMK